MKKIIFIGNSCTGKTTAMFSLISKLKQEKFLVGYVLDVCRFPTFDPSLFDTRPEARMYIIFNQLMKECEASLRHDCDYMISERSAIDWLIYLFLTFNCLSDKDKLKYTGMVDAVSDLVNLWVLKTYDLIIYMDAKGMYYVNDGFRPASTKNRDEAQELYDGAVSELLNHKEIKNKVFVVRGNNLKAREEQVFKIVEEWMKNGNTIKRKSRKKLYGKAGK